MFHIIKTSASLLCAQTTSILSPSSASVLQHYHPWRKIPSPGHIWPLRNVSCFLIIFLACWWKCYHLWYLQKGGCSRVLKSERTETPRWQTEFTDGCSWERSMELDGIQSLSEDLWKDSCLCGDSIIILLVFKPRRDVCDCLLSNLFCHRSNHRELQQATDNYVMCKSLTK